MPSRIVKMALMKFRFLKKKQILSHTNLLQKLSHVAEEKIISGENGKKYFLYQKENKGQQKIISI